jgi:hypothetical protein
VKGPGQATRRPVPATSGQSLDRNAGNIHPKPSTLAYSDTCLGSADRSGDQVCAFFHPAEKPTRVAAARRRTSSTMVTGKAPSGGVSSPGG